MLESWAQGLWMQTQLFSLAAAGVWILRACLLRWFGAQAAYFAWLAVPTICLAAALPWPSALADAMVSPVMPNLSASMLPFAPPSPAASTGRLASALLLGWLVGGALIVVRLVRQHRGLLRRLRPWPDQAHWQGPAGSSPAMFGLWQPRLVLPADFQQRFDPSEQAAILAHEAVHADRRDNLCNLLATAWAVCLWFNPLAVGWHTTHPLVQRVAMLKHHPRSLARRHTGLGLVALLCLGAAGLGHALQAAAANLASDPATPAHPESVMLYIQVDQDGTPLASPRLFGRLGQSMSMQWTRGDAQAGPWRLELTVTTRDGKQLQLDGRLSSGRPLQLVAQPRLVTPNGEPARFETRSADGQQVLGIAILARLADQPDLRKTAAAASQLAKP